MDLGIDSLARNELRRAERQTRDLWQQHGHPVFLVAVLFPKLSTAMRRSKFAQPSSY